MTVVAKRVRVLVVVVVVVELVVSVLLAESVLVVRLVMVLMTEPASLLATEPGIGKGSVMLKTGSKTEAG